MDSRKTKTIVRYTDNQIKDYIEKNNLLENRDFLEKAQIGTYTLTQFIQNKFTIEENTRKNLLIAIFWHIKKTKKVDVYD